MKPYEYIDRNVAEVRENMRVASEAAGRRAEDVTLLAAIKYADADEVEYLIKTLGVTDVGENRVQQLLSRWDMLQASGARVHFIGTLQPNKVKYLVDKVCMIHSLDSLKLAAEIDRQAEKHGTVMDVLCEINSGHEETKSGVAPEEAEAFCRALSDFPHIRLRGFMTMAPICENPEDSRKYFRETFRLCLDIWEKKLHNKIRPIMSMGMSGSYREAIAEGATVVRVGRGLFAGKPEADDTPQ